MGWVEETPILPPSLQCPPGGQHLDGHVDVTVWPRRKDSGIVEEQVDDRPTDKSVIEAKSVESARDGAKRADIRRWHGSASRTSMSRPIAASFNLLLRPWVGNGGLSSALQPR